MRRNILATWLIVSGIAAFSPSAFAAGSDLDITINVVGPNQDVQGAIENHIAIPEGDRQLAPRGSASESIGAGSGASESTSQLGEAGQETQDSVQQSTQQAQDSAQQSTQESAQQSQESAQQAQQDAQDATSQSGDQ